MFSQFVYRKVGGFMREDYIVHPADDCNTLQIAECEVARDYLSQLCKAALLEHGTMRVGHVGIVVCNQRERINGEYHYDILLRIVDFDMVNSVGIVSMVGMFKHYSHEVVYVNNYGAAEVHITLSAISQGVPYL